MRNTLIGAVLASMMILLGCGRDSGKPEMTMLIRMMPAQEKYFTEEIIPAFEKDNNCKIKVATFQDMWDIEATLKLEKGSRKPSISLVKVPFEMTRVLAGKGYIKPLKKIVDSLQLDMDVAEYHPLALGLGSMEKELYYIPRKLETRVLFYLKSKVAEAVGNFEKMKKEINAALKKQNGYGLPKDYQLEADPNLWDLYDIFTVGYIWAHTEYFGVKMPRIAFRGAPYEGTALGFIDNAIGLGATQEDILKLNSESVIRMYQWQSRLIKNGILNPAMWQDPMRGANIWEAFRDGKVFLTTAQQIDCFFMHGWEKSMEMPGYLKDPSDMGLAVMPLGVSFDLKKSGDYEFIGTRQVTTGGWWWGIPKTSPHADLAYKLARFITNKENQAEECSRFGMMPVRKDIVNNLQGVFESGWVGEIFRVSADQLQINKLSTIPLTPQYSEICRNLIDVWYGACVPAGADKGPITSPSGLKKVVSGKYMDAQRKILGDDFPQ